MAIGSFGLRIPTKGIIPLISEQHTMQQAQQEGGEEQTPGAGGRWAPVLAQRDAPAPRHGHTAVVHKDGLFLFGGFAEGGISLNDLRHFSFCTSSSPRLKCGTLTKRLAQHKAPGGR
jgi:hypothetical protein